MYINYVSKERDFNLMKCLCFIYRNIYYNENRFDSTEVNQR